MKIPTLPAIKELVYIITSYKKLISPVSYTQKQIADKMVYTFDVSHRSLAGENERTEAEMAQCPILKKETLAVLMSKTQEHCYPNISLRLVGLGLGHHLAMRLCADLTEQSYPLIKPTRLSLIQPLFLQHHLYSKSSLEKLKSLADKGVAIDIYRCPPGNNATLLSYDDASLHHQVYPCIDLQPVPQFPRAVERCLHFYLSSLSYQPGDAHNHPHGGLISSDVFAHYGYHYRQIPFDKRHKSTSDELIEQPFVPNLKKDFLNPEHQKLLRFSDTPTGEKIDDSYDNFWILPGSPMLLR